jgi:hypothetical protein
VLVNRLLRSAGGTAILLPLEVPLAKLESAAPTISLRLVLSATVELCAADSLATDELEGDDAVLSVEDMMATLDTSFDSVD